jgi:hypothetical protein
LTHRIDESDLRWYRGHAIVTRMQFEGCFIETRQQWQVESSRNGGILDKIISSIQIDELSDSLWIPARKFRLLIPGHGVANQRHRFVLSSGACDNRLYADPV